MAEVIKGQTSTSAILNVKVTDDGSGLGILNVYAGANSGVDIGDVTINNASGAAAVNIQDGGNSITIDGTVTSLLKETSGTINISGVDYTVKHSTPANVAASQTDSSIVAAVTGKKIRVLSYQIVCGATATTVVFNSKGAGAGTAISMIFQNGANGGEIGNNNPHGWFETNSGEALTVTTGTGSTTGIQVNYIEV